MAISFRRVFRCLLSSLCCGPERESEKNELPEKSHPVKHIDDRRAGNLSLAELEDILKIKRKKGLIVDAAREPRTALPNNLGALTSSNNRQRRLTKVESYDHQSLLFFCFEKELERLLIEDLSCPSLGTTSIETEGGCRLVVEHGGVIKVLTAMSDFVVNHEAPSGESRGLVIAGLEEGQGADTKIDCLLKMGIPPYLWEPRSC